MTSDNALTCTVTQSGGKKHQMQTSQYWVKPSDRRICFEFEITEGDLISVGELCNLSLSFDDEQILTIGSMQQYMKKVHPYYEIMTNGACAKVKLFATDKGDYLARVQVEADSAEMICVLFNTKSRKTPPDLSRAVETERRKNGRKRRKDLQI